MRREEKSEMIKFYERPELRLSNIEESGVLCGSGAPMCYITPIDADVAYFEDGGEATFGDDYVLNY